MLHKSGNTTDMAGNAYVIEQATRYYDSCYTVVTLLHSCHTVGTLLLLFCYTVVTPLLHSCYTGVTLLLHCTHTFVTLLLQG
jgi:hypothetical protein